uniref:DOG1 domain-containing protein n=1 Tax=Ananas comosus var. bracteatus TaxID=296719 RepID=A0A6V7NSH9_ANACO|nr:unnamed protein product [Ananas comosus var. bracteatus]
MGFGYSINDQQHGAAYFGELEEALMQRVDGVEGDGDTKYTNILPTLEIFPSWSMRYQQIHGGDLGSAGKNTASEVESESPLSRNQDSSEQTSEKKQKNILMANDASVIGAAQNNKLGAQEKRKITGSMRKEGNLLDAKAYVQQLESSRIRLQQLEQELQRSQSQGLFLGGCIAPGDINSGAAAVFDIEYNRWLDDNGKHLSALRAGLQARLLDGNLGLIIDECLAHHDELFRLRAVAAKCDAFHLLIGTWTTPAERCFLWMGGFRPSELIKILMPHLDPLTEQQLMGICSLQQSSQQAEEALLQGFEQLHHSLADTVATGLPANDGTLSYMDYTAVALDKLANLEVFIRQADNLRQQTLHQIRHILTTQQAARCFLAIGEYYSRLRALSSLWASRPLQNFAANESGWSTATDVHVIQQPSKPTNLGASDKLCAEKGIISGSPIF